MGLASHPHKCKNPFSYAQSSSYPLLEQPIILSITYPSTTCPLLYPDVQQNFLISQYSVNKTFASLSLERRDMTRVREKEQGQALIR